MARKPKNDPHAAASRRAHPARGAVDPAHADPETELKIIGGYHRGRKLAYHGDPLVRPMKHRTRESIFNLLSTEIEDLYAIDLFAGTGALGLEALSRGAVGATFIEKHVPSARIVADNIATLDVGGQAQLLVTSAFVWAKRDMTSASVGPPADVPWLVFCSPPYAFFVERLDDMLDLAGRIAKHAPAGSILVVEADDRLDFSRFTAAEPEAWDVRSYPPAVIGIWRGDRRHLPKSAPGSSPPFREP